MSSPRARAASELVKVLEAPFLRALTEPSRLEVLKALIVHGPADIGQLAEHLPQERSVVSRHLQTLHEAGVVTQTRDGRRRVYDVDGAAVLGGFERLLARARLLIAACCPPSPRGDA